MKKIILLILILFHFTPAHAFLYEEKYSGEQIAKILKSEYESMLALVKTLQADNVVGGVLNVKEYPDYEIHWMLAEDDVRDYDRISIYREGLKGEQGFSVTYFRARYFIKGRNVIRRFIGPHLTGWRNDTIDYETGAYYGKQGVPAPNIKKSDLHIINQFKITLFAE